MEENRIKVLFKDKRVQIGCLLFAVLLGNLFMGLISPQALAAGKEESAATSESVVEVIPEEELTKKEEETEEPVTLTVFVCGAVREEGVYVLPQGARVSDAVRQAGGFAGEAQTDALNLASPLKDGDMIRVPSEEEIEEGRVVKEEATAGLPATDRNPSSVINLNTAGKETLMTLEGIGEAKAQKIIAYREQTPFTKIEDIQNVSGIGASIFAKIKDRITVE
ncbi:MAG: ComEA family DNA-binding protein [Lachnospiraceae bacterium]|nr:ComEA family DNA-binding protein [Lachnospiraceae bacterium]